MINEIKINGSKSTTYHDFTFSTNGMNLVISGGTYYQNNNVVYTDANGGSIAIPTSPDMTYEICLMASDEVHVLQYSNPDDAIKFYENNNVIDLLAWFTVPVNTTTLDNVQINVKAMVDTDAN